MCFDHCIFLSNSNTYFWAWQVIVKLESFTPRGAEAGRGGVLKRMHQLEDNAFLVMDR